MSASDIKLYVSVCSGRGWAGAFGYSLAGLTFRLGYDKLGGRMKGYALTVARQANIVVSRNDHILEAIKGGFTHFLSLDDDMVFPADVVERLLAHEKPVVAVNYRKKTPERIECVCGDLDGEPLSSDGKSGLEQIGSMGMGVTLIDLEAIKHVPAPYFAVIWNRDKQNYMIEDGVFSQLLKEHGVTLWCDHDLSRDIGHVGEIEYYVPPLGMTVLPVAEKSQETVFESRQHRAS